jgi:peroxidase
MKMSRTAAVAVVALALLSVSFTGHCYGGAGALQVGFYKGRCGFLDVETIVASVVKASLFKDPTIAPALIRMQFHDCFVKVSFFFSFLFSLSFRSIGGSLA